MIRILCATILFAVTLSAAPILTLNPVNGAVSGERGTYVAWGFTINSDPLDWIVFTSVQGNLPVPGNFSDFLSSFVSNSEYALAPQAPDWTEISTPDTPFVAGALAIFEIGPFAPFGVTAGSLIVSYDRYDANPFLIANANFLGSGEFIKLVTIEVVDPISAPEPGTIGLAAISMAALLLVRRQAIKGKQL